MTKYFSFLFVVVLGAACSLQSAPLKRIADFELSDQENKVRSFRFPKDRVTVMTVADHEGSKQLQPWIALVHGRYGNRIDIDGIADVSMIAKPFHGIFRTAFRKQIAYSVMLDWEGAVVRQFGYTKSLPNIFVIDRRGFITKHIAGPMSECGRRELFQEIDRVLGASDGVGSG